MNRLKATLQVKNKMYYCVISYKDEKENKWKLKWKTTKVEEKPGNIKKAKATFPKIIEDFQKELAEKEHEEILENDSYEKRIEENKNKLFLDFINESLEEFRPNIELTTYYNWKNVLVSKISNYFGVYNKLEKVICEDVKRPTYYKKDLKISEVNQFDIEDFMTWLHKCGLKGSTIKKYYVFLNLVFKRAVRLKIFTLETNPIKDVPKPTIEPYTADYYTPQELIVLFDIMKNERIYIPVVLSAYYGLRRSEVLGIKWSAIDFKNKFLTIKHTVTRVRGTGENQEICSKEFTKNNDIRTLPLIPEVEQILLEHKKEVEDNKRFYGNAYTKITEDYVCVNEIGELIKPDYITQSFGEILKANSDKIKKIKFHSLRHSVR